MQQLGNKQADKNEEDLQNWQSILRTLAQLTYKVPFNPVVAPPTKDKDGNKVSDPLCMSEHFIESQITNISAYDASGKEYKIGDPTNPLELPQKISHFTTHIEYMELKYTPPKNSDKETLEITGQQYDFTSADLDEAYNAGLEKAKSALNLAYWAKSMGWEEVDFDQTTDPIDRFMLMRACQYVGLDYGDEQVSKSTVDGVIIQPINAKDSILVQNAANSIKKSQLTDEAKKAKNPIIIAVDEAFESFLQSSRAPIGAKENSNSTASKPTHKLTAAEQAFN